MASIKVKFRPSSTYGKEGTVFYQVLHDKKARSISTKFKIFDSEWNARSSSVAFGGNQERVPYIHYVKEGIKLDLKRMVRVIHDLEKTMLEYSAEDIVQGYIRLVEANSLFRYMEGMIAKLKSNGRIRTAETYQTTLNSFRNFRAGADAMLDSLDQSVMEAYESWQRNRGLSPNTVSFYARVLRAVYNRAVDDGLTENNYPFRNVYTGVEKTVKRALPLRIIKKIKCLELASDPDLEYARDMFILSFMLRGMSLIDMAYLLKKDLNNGYLTYRRRKTGQKLMIEWTKEMQMIVDKYPNVGCEYLLPIIRNPDSIPVYAYRNAGYRINRQLKHISKSLDLPMPLTMYVARHSWASAAKAKGIPIGVISEGMGHDSESTTRIYLASLDTSMVDRANSLLLSELEK